jgi:hypothetical protein
VAPFCGVQKEICGAAVKRVVWHKVAHWLGYETEEQVAGPPGKLTRLGREQGYHGKNHAIVREMNSLLAWPGHHPVAFSLSLFVPSALVSIYGSSIRSFIHEWPKHKFRERRHRFIQGRLDELKKIHNDSYQLNLYVFWYLAHGFIRGMIFGGICVLVLLVTKQNPSGFTFAAGLAGTVAGVLSRIKELIEDLENYETVIDSLSTELEDYQAVETKHATQSGT